MDLRRSLYQLLHEIGEGQKISRSAYDTAWIARLFELGEPMGEAALNWLREHQLADGSWGNRAPYYCHERLVCTLAAMIALGKKGCGRDRKRLERAQGAAEARMRSAYQDVLEDLAGLFVVDGFQCDDSGPVVLVDDMHAAHVDIGLGEAA